MSVQKHCMIAHFWSKAHLCEGSAPKQRSAGTDDDVSGQLNVSWSDWTTSRFEGVAVGHASRT